MNGPFRSWSSELRKFEIILFGINLDLNLIRKLNKGNKFNI